MKIPTLVAHRGDMEHYPENSLIGLESALRAGACVIEFDLQMTADGEFLLLHEPDLKRTAGWDINVFELSAGQLAGVSVHEPERFGKRFASTPIARLGEVLELLGRCPKAGALVEIKVESLDRWGLEAVMERLLKILQPFWSQCTLISRVPEALAYARLRVGGPIGLVLHRYDGPHRQKAMELAPELLICNQRKIGEMTQPWPGRWHWMLYDITDPARALAWAEKGVEFIETRDIGTLLKDPRLARKACYHGL